MPLGPDKTGELNAGHGIARHSRVQSSLLTSASGGASHRTAVASTLLMFSMMGVGFYGLPIYVAVLSNDPRIGSTVAATAATVYVLVSGIGGSAIGWLMRVLTLRVLLLVGAILAALALVVLGQAEGPWFVLVAMSGLGLGTSLAGLVPAMAMIVRSYGSRATRLTVLATTSIPVSGMVVPPLASALIDAHGFAAAAWWLAGAYLAVVCVAVGLLPAGVPGQPEDAPTLVTSTSSEQRLPDRPRRMVIVWLALCITAMFLAQTSMLAHIVTLGLDRGLSNAAVALTVVSIVSLVGRLLSIRMIEHVAIHRFAALVTATQAVAAIVLALATGASAFYVGAAVLGFSVANAITVIPILVSASTPSQHYASVFGIVWSVSVILSAFGPIAVEGLRAWAGGYQQALLMLAFVAIIATVALWLGGRRSAIQPVGPDLSLPDGLAGGGSR